MFSSLSVRVPGSFGSAHWMIGRVLSVIGLSSLDADITSLAVLGAFYHLRITSLW
jgi:hypothetical protein